MVQVQVGDVTHDVKVMVPANRTRDSLVVLLHGGNGDAAKILRQTGYGARSEQAGFVVAMPEGQATDGKLKWNSGKLDLKEPRNDVALLDGLARVARDEGCVTRVGAIGFSNGAQMANRWACEGTQVDAIVVSAGGLMVPRSQCRDRSVPVLSYVGEKDPAFQKSPTEHKRLPSIKESCAGWRDHLQCGDEPRSVDRVGKATCRAFEGRAAMRECVVKGMGHQFPSEKAAGFDASTDSWRWLQAQGL